MEVTIEIKVIIVTIIIRHATAHGHHDLKGMRPLEVAINVGKIVICGRGMDYIRAQWLIVNRHCAKILRQQRL